MKCTRCGKKNVDPSLTICDICGYVFSEDNKKEKDDLEFYPGKRKSDLIDAPILSFILGIVGMVIPIFVLSVLAIYLGKKPSKSGLVPFAHIGEILGYFGIAVSAFFVIYLFF